MRILRAAVLVAALFTVGCSRVSLAWRFAPWMLERECAAMLGVPKDQRDALGRDVRGYLEGLAGQEAGKLAAWGRALSHDFEAGRDAEALAQLFDSADRHWDALLAPGVPLAAAWMARDPLRSAAALRKSFAERNARDFKRWSDPQRATADREKRLRSGLRDYLGDLTETQEDGLRAWAQRAEFPIAAWKADRLRRQEALLKRLEAGPGTEASLLQDLETQLRHWWLTPQVDRERGYQQELDAYKARLRTAAAQLLASLTPAQRERLARRLHALAEDIDAIGLKAASNKAFSAG